MSMSAAMKAKKSVPTKEIKKKKAKKKKSTKKSKAVASAPSTKNNGRMQQQYRLSPHQHQQQQQQQLQLQQHQQQQQQQLRQQQQQINYPQYHLQPHEHHQRTTHPSSSPLQLQHQRYGTKEELAAAVAAAAMPPPLQETTVTYTTPASTVDGIPPLQTVVTYSTPPSTAEQKPQKKKKTTTMTASRAGRQQTQQRGTTNTSVIGGNSQPKQKSDPLAMLAQITTDEATRKKPRRGEAAGQNAKLANPPEDSVQVNLYIYIYWYMYISVWIRVYNCIHIFWKERNNFQKNISRGKCRWLLPTSRSRILPSSSSSSHRITSHLYRNNLHRTAILYLRRCRMFRTSRSWHLSGRLAFR